MGGKKEREWKKKEQSHRGVKRRGKVTNDQAGGVGVKKRKAWLWSRKNAGVKKNSKGGKREERWCGGGAKKKCR